MKPNTAIEPWSEGEIFLRCFIVSYIVVFFTVI
jgi:hypothetical protein